MLPISSTPRPTWRIRLHPNSMPTAKQQEHQAQIGQEPDDLYVGGREGWGKVKGTDEDPGKQVNRGWRAVADA